jgi:hypothetical protein
MQKIKQYRWSPTLGDFEDSPEITWGVKPYDPDSTEPCVFCGIYGLKDFYALWRYKGEKHIWWVGSDIRNFRNGYWLDDKGSIRFSPRPFAQWIINNCVSWVENNVEREALLEFGIDSLVVPSFLGDVTKFPRQVIDPEKRYYSSVSGNDFQLYGWDKINEIARKNPDTKYYLYGNTVPWLAPENVIVRGRVPKEVMNEEVKTMTGCIRMVEFEGCSEILVKSVLWGQRPISLIDYSFLHSDNPRESLLNKLNRYDFNSNI